MAPYICIILTGKRDKIGLGGTSGSLLMTKRNGQVKDR
jgi:hypothetical protein